MQGAPRHKLENRRGPLGALARLQAMLETRTKTGAVVVQLMKMMVVVALYQAGKVGSIALRTIDLHLLSSGLAHPGEL